MRNFLRSWPSLALRRRGCFVAPRLEQLENRIVFALSPTPLPFTDAGTAHAAAVLKAPNDFQLYQIHLEASDVITAAVSSQPGGGALQSNLRIFDATGRPLALDAQLGGDARLTFQAATEGEYLVGVSSAGDYTYDPSVATSGKGGATTGLYSLDLQRQKAALTPDLAGASFQLQTNAAAYGDTVTGTFTLDNRGGAAAGAFDVQLLLSADNLFGPSSQVLTTFQRAGLGAGQESGPFIFTIQVPNPAQAKALGLPVSGPIYVGLRIDPARAVPELNSHDQSGVHAGEDWQALTVVTPVTANGSNHTSASAQTLGDLNSRVSGVLAAGQTDWYQLTVSKDVRNVQLTATVTASVSGTLLPRLTLAGKDGRVLIQSDDGSLVQHLPEGTYTLAVSTRSGAGAYQLTLTGVQTKAPFKPISVATWMGGAVAADVNGDGKPDIVTANYNYAAFGSYRKYSNGGISVLLGNGDGTFGPLQTFDGGSNPSSVLVADINGDGKPDLVVQNNGRYNYNTHKFYNSNVSVLLGNGDGTFGSPQTFDSGYNPQSVVVADVNGDGKPDLIVDNWGRLNPTTGKYDKAGIAVLLGRGDGTFRPPQIVAGFYPAPIVAADVNGDGKPDLIVENKGTYNSTTHNYDNAGVRVLLGNGNGTFQKPQFYLIGNTSLGPLRVADVNGDGKPDIIVDNKGTYNSTTGKYDNQGISVLLGNGDGTFQNAKSSIIKGAPTYSMFVADVNGDGKPDIVAGDGYAGYVGVMLGNGDGTFQKPQLIANGSNLLAVGDVNGDAKPDVITTKYDYRAKIDTIIVLLGNGDGAFQNPPPPHALATGVSFPFARVADLKGDGTPDIITGSYYSSSSSNPVNLLLGNDDGTFQNPQTLAGVSGFVTVADLNNDGRPDLIDQTGSVFLGNGDGTFRKLPTSIAASGSVAAVADVNGDGEPDIITTKYDPSNRSDAIRVLLGKGDGTFQPAREIYSFKDTYVQKVIVADINGDGKPDIILGGYGDSNNIQVLRGKGDGTFQKPPQLIASGSYLVAVADVNGDGKPDIISTEYDSQDHSYAVRVLLGKGNGAFQPEDATIPVQNYGYNAFVADVNGDGKPDIVLGGYGDTTGIQELLGNGDGTFQKPQLISNGVYTWLDAVADVNGDNRSDLITAGPGDGLRVLLGNADGSFTQAPSTIQAIGRNTPYLADLNGDGVPDSVILNSAGAILFRKGLPGAANSFDPPILLNPGRSASDLPTRPARDLTVLHTTTGLAVATADARPDSGASEPLYTVSLYRVAKDGTFQRTTAFTTDRQPTRIVAADLTGNGLDDIIVANSLNDSIQIAFQQSDGTFRTLPALPTGHSPSDITVADFNGDGLPDIAVTDQGSGDVSIFLNDPQHSFTESYRYRAGSGLYGLDTTVAPPVISSLENTVSLTAGNFTGRGRNDLVVVNRGSDSLSILANDGQGGFADPQAALTTSTSDGTKTNTQANEVIAGHFHGPDKPTDLAVLLKGRGEVWIYTGNGDGTFRHTFSIPAGFQPTGLNSFLNPQTGFEDLLIGDSFGDVLHLQGKGNGEFQIAGRRTSLAAQILNNGQTYVLVANQQSGRLTLQAPKSGSSQITPIVTLDDGTQSTLAPGYVQWAKLDKGSPYYDAVVVASGGNEVLVYRGTGFDAAGNPTFAAPVSYPVGTNPVSVTIQDLNGNAVPDLIVANQGSNDVSIVFGSWDMSGNWVGEPGPRLKSGGSGPVAAQAFIPAGGGLPELVVANGQSGNLTVLPGANHGFFKDQNPQIINPPGNPVFTQGPTFFGSTDSGVLLTTAGQLIGFNVDDLADSMSTLFTSPPGQLLAAAQALANGHVVAVMSSGSVVDLAPANGGLIQDSSFVPQTGIPSEPSALTVLQQESGTQVLVTSAGGDLVFTFSAPEVSEGQVPPEVPIGPVVDVTPLAGGSLTVVATLTADTGSTTTLVGNNIAAEEEGMSEEALTNLGLAALGAGSPAWALGLLTRLQTGEPSEDPGEDGVEVQDAKPAVVAEKPRPVPDGLDLDKLLRELDLYQPPPNPEPPAPISRRPEEGRDQELIARTSATDVETLPAAPAVTAEDEEPPRWTRVAGVVPAMVCDLEAPPAHAAVSDAVLMQTASSWDGENWQLLGLAGLTLWPWPGYGFTSAGELQPEQDLRTRERKRQPTRA